MAEPLPYYNPKRPESEPSGGVVGESGSSLSSADLCRAAYGGRGEAVAVPAAFDARLELSADAATTAAVEAALRRAKIPVFRGRDASATGGGPIELHVRRDDLAAARAVAAGVEGRRRRLRETAPPRPPAAGVG